MQNSTLRVIAVIVLVAVGTIALFIAAYNFFSRIPDEEDAEEIGVPQLESDADATVFISEDAGKTWRGIKDTRFRVDKLMFHPVTGDLFVGTQRNSLWVSENSRGTFQQIKDDAEMVDEKALILDMVSVSGGEVRAYVAASYGGKGRVLSLIDSLYRELFFTPLAKTFVFDIDVDPGDSRRIFLISGDGGFIESRDGGETWRTVYRFKNAPNRLVVHPGIAGKFWVTTLRGEVLLTTDYAATWIDMSAGLNKFPKARDIENLYLDTRGNILYLTSGYGLLKSQDDGKTWEPVNLIVPPASLPIIAFAADPVNSGVIYISAASQLYKSTDGGVTWQGMDFLGRRNIKSIVIDPHNSNRVFIGLDR